MIRKTAIRAWFDENDQFFDNPPKALDAGFSLTELAWMYEDTYLTKEDAARWMAFDIQKAQVER